MAFSIFKCQVGERIHIIITHVTFFRHFKNGTSRNCQQDFLNQAERHVLSWTWPNRYTASHQTGQRIANCRVEAPIGHPAPWGWSGRSVPRKMFLHVQIRSTFWRCFVCCCVLHDFTTLAILLPWILVHPFKLVHLWHRSVRVNCQEISTRCPSQEPLGIKSYAISHGLQLLQVGMCMCHITVWSYRPYRYILVITHVLI